MNIQPISISNNYQKPNLNFKSKIVKTKYMDDLLKECVLKPKGKAHILENLKKILLDGKENLVKIDYYKKGLIPLLIPASYKISINGKENLWNCTFSGTGISVQGSNALKDVLAHEDMKLQQPLEENVHKNSKLAEIKKNFEKAWGAFISAEDNSPKIEATLKKNMEYYRWKYDVELQKEFIKLRQEIFPESPIINPPKPTIERYVHIDD